MEGSEDFPGGVVTIEEVPTIDPGGGRLYWWHPQDAAWGFGSQLLPCCGSAPSAEVLFPPSRWKQADLNHRQV